MIERRVSLALRFLSLRQAGTWSEADKTAAQAFDQQLQLAHKTCCNDLPRLQREKRKLRVEVFQFIHGRALEAGPTHKIALHLSNLQGVPLSNFAQAIPMTESRPLHEALHKSNSTCAEIFQELQGGSLTVWAPTERPALLQLATAFQADSMLRQLRRRQRRLRT